MQNIVDLTHASSDEEVTAGPSRRFRIDTRHLELTYARCSATVEDVKEFLDSSVLNSPQCHSWFAAREYHQDGTPHYHILVKFNKRRTFRDEREFDFLGHHPRIGAVRDVHNYFRYLSNPEKPSRDQTFASADWLDPIPLHDRGGTVRTGSRRGDGESENGIGWGDIVKAPSQDEYFSLIRARFPRDYALSLQRLEYTATRLFPSKSAYVPEYERGTFNVPPELNEWADTTRFDRYRPKSLVLCGPSRIGKTEWARSLGRHTYWYGQPNIDTWDDGAEYLIMDDFSPDIAKYMPMWKGFFGAQKELNITQKYRGIYTKKYGKPLLWLCNSIPIMTDAMREWMNENAIIVFIYDKMYDPPQ